MFIVNLTYIKPLDAVEKYLEKHINFLNQYYAKGLFIASGRKNPPEFETIIGKPFGDK